MFCELMRPPLLELRQKTLGCVCCFRGFALEGKLEMSPVMYMILGGKISQGKVEGSWN